jgi:hypothetical protein
MAWAMCQASSPTLARLAKDEFMKTRQRELPSALMRARQDHRRIRDQAIQALRDHLNDEVEQRHAAPLKPSSRSRIHSTNRT